MSDSANYDKYEEYNYDQDKLTGHGGKGNNSACHNFFYGASEKPFLS